MLFVTALAAAPLGATGLVACGDNAAPDPATCAPLPLVAGTQATNELALAPARCGLPAYSWLRDPDLGTITATGDDAEYTATQLEALAATAKVTLPQAPQYDVAVKVVAYTTQDRGAKVSSSAAIAYPTNLTSGTKPPVMLFLHGTSGFKHGCGPTVDSQAQLLGAVFASAGWIVVMPDYLGLESLGPDYPALHPYLVGEATALASLDAARAAVRLATGEGICPAPELAVLGGSQGGHAALFVDRLAPYYAREFELLGTVTTVPPSDLVAHTDRALRALVPASANVLATLVTQAPWYGKTALLNQVLKAPWDTSVAAALEMQCDPEAAVEPRSLAEVFSPGLLNHMQAPAATSATFPEFGCTLKENSVVETSIARINPTSPSYGILFILGSNDTLVVPEIERTAYDKLCSQGLPLQFIECTDASHTQATAWSVPTILSFLDDRRARKPFTKECTRPAAARCPGQPQM